jgi:hypothetical protein
MGFKQNIVDFLSVFVNMRKMIVMMLLIAVGITFRLTNLVNGQEFVDLLKNTVVAFFASNSIEHVGLTLRTMLNNKGKTVEKLVPEATDGQP